MILRLIMPFFVHENLTKFIAGLSVVNDHADTMSALSISRHQKISRNRFRLFKYSFKDQLELFDNWKGWKSRDTLHLWDVNRISSLTSNSSSDTIM